MPKWFYDLPFINHPNKLSYSLYDLNEYVRQVLALNFSDALWVRCELAQVKYSRGHCYIDLVQKSEDGQDIVAQAQAALWALQLRSLRNKLGLELDTILQEGMEVLMLVKVEYHERFGLKLMVHDIDPAYTLGQLALKRRETILRLKKEGLLEKNKTLLLPPVIQRIAILSSENAAGLKDFLNELSGNEFGYAFRFHLFPVAMQGGKVAEEISASLKKINPADFDALVIIRGGGSKLDLVAFDDYGLCRNLALVPLPLICGIGHEVDDTVLDQVAHTSLKTPTAVAGFIIHQNLRFESEIVQFGNEVKNVTTRIIQQQSLVLQQMELYVGKTASTQLRQQKMMIGFIEKELPIVLRNNLAISTAKLELLEKSAYFLSPETALKRGFTITLKNSKPVTDNGQLEEGDEIETVFYKNKTTSKVIRGGGRTVDARK